MPRKIENEQYKKIEIKNDVNKNTNSNSNKYTGCVKKIEITNIFKMNINSQPTLEDISASKDSNLIDWEFNNSNNNKNSGNINNNVIENNINEIISENNMNNDNDNDNDNKSLSNREKAPLIDNLIINQKKDDLFNSSEFNSNIKEGVIVENDINLIDEKVDIKNINNNNDSNNKELLELNEKKSRNNNNDITIKNDPNQKSENNNNDNKIDPSDVNNYNIALNLNNNLKNNKKFSKNYPTII